MVKAASPDKVLVEGDHLGKTLSRTEALTLSVELAVANVRKGGGPFGAVILNSSMEVIGIGVNAVVSNRDSTAHAEICAIRSAENRIQNYSLENCSLYSSCAPCIMCFGAIYWSGLKEVVFGAPKETAEAVGFMEGPVSPELWEAAKADKEIVCSRLAISEELIARPFELYRELNGVIY